MSIILVCQSEAIFLVHKVYKVRKVYKVLGNVLDCHSERSRDLPDYIQAGIPFREQRDPRLTVGQVSTLVEMTEGTFLYPLVMLYYNTL
jgi:hypothetical protein